MKPSNLFCGFMVSPTPTSRTLNADRFCGFSVLWFRPLPSLGHQTPIGFVVSRFHGFVVSPTPSLGHQMPIGFMVLWFHGRMAYLTKPSMKPSDLFRGFMVLPTPSLRHQMPIGFVVSPTPTSRRLNADRFRVFRVSWFHPLHLLDIK